MKDLSTYIKEALEISNINEALKINKSSKIQEYNYHPETNDELRKLIDKLLEERGYDADLNDIDVSKIDDFRDVFSYDPRKPYDTHKFNGDISRWDVSNAKDMSHMFVGSSFDGDLSNWNVSNVEYMHNMFYASEFTGKNGDISKWNVSNVEDMMYMFTNSHFNSDINDWDVSNVEYMHNMFKDCPLENNPPTWYKN